MRIQIIQATTQAAVLALGFLLLTTGPAHAQQQVNLTAASAVTTLPDGAQVPMWGYTCGAAVANSTATCAAANPNANGGWSPVILTVPAGASLQINLTNSLSFSNGNSVPTSLMIVGQLGGGLGTPGAFAPSPTHGTQTDATWSTVAPAAQPFTPPQQGPRVRSFGTEVAAGATTALTWNNLQPGTYLLESGTHPSIQGTMGLYGVLVVTNAPTSTNGIETAAGTAYPGISYDTELPLIFSEIDPVQNKAVTTAVNTKGFDPNEVWSGLAGGCGNPASPTYNTCYPPVVNYTPIYYLINGVAFSRTAPSASLFPVTPARTLLTGGQTILVRLVNAGSRMHVPSIVGAQTGTSSSNGFSLIAEDGNPLPGIPRIQNEVFMAAGKTYDVMINVPPVGPTALPRAIGVYDRELSLSANKINRDSGMLAYISVNGSVLPTTPGFGGAVARADSYNALTPGHAFTLADPSKGVVANDSNVNGVTLLVPPANGTVILNADGTFSYTPNAGSSAKSDSFTYCANGTVTGSTCSSGVTAQVTLGAATIETASNITIPGSTWTSKVATYIKIPSPGILSGAVDAAGYPLSVVTSSVQGTGFATLVPDAKGGFTATVAPHPGGPATATFTFQAQNSQGVVSTPVDVVVNFPAPSGLAVTVKDPKSGAILTDYRWIIEEDRTFYIDPNCTTNPPTGNCLSRVAPVVPILGANFHTSDMPYVAQGCTGIQSCEGGQTLLGQPAVCDVGNGVCRADATGSGNNPVTPDQVSLDPTRRYYISVLPGDAANPFISGNSGTTCSTTTIGNNASASTCGHSMGGAPISFPANATAGTPPNPVTVAVEQDPFPPSKLSVNVFEDDFPLNGEQDSGGGVDVLATNEPGLGSFNIVLWDDMGGSGDVTGQMTYDMFNQPLSNSLDGQIDPVTGNNACPITKQATGMTGMIPVCPTYESDGKTLSPLAGQAVIANLMPGRFSVQAVPGADRIARGEEWLQTNTLDGQKAHDSFLRIGEPAYFQEFGPANYHVSIGFANPVIINGRKAGVCGGSDPNLTASNCGNTLQGKVTTERMSRTPDERLYSSGSHDSFYWTQCYISVGDPDGEDFAFTKCNPDGTFTLAGLPDGDWRVTVFDEWNDMLVDGLSTPIGLSKGASGGTTNMGDIATNQWQSNVYTRTFIDTNESGVSTQDKPGLGVVNTTVRYRDGSLANNLSTDFTGTANFNETFPLFNWYVVETDTTRYKNTGTHTVYDAGGPADGSAACGQAGYPPCGNSTIGKYMANTADQNPLPADLSVPGSVYCKTADCINQSILNGASPSGSSVSTGRIDNPWLGAVEGWQGFSGQNNFIEFGKAPYIPGENGGIHGHVVYASTRPFDDPQMLVQTQWEPLVPHVTMNLYQEGVASDGVTPTLTLVDTTQTSSWDDWAQGFHVGPNGETIPNMNCPGQSTNDLFFFSLKNQPQYLDLYNNVEHGSAAGVTALPYNSQFKCYDGMHNWNQLQPAVYDGMYSFPSVTSTDANGKPNGTNCTICGKDPATDMYAGIPMLPPGKYVVEVVPPPGYEIVKEEDKNILIGDNFIAPVTQEFGALGDIFILPDQAQVASAYNSYNAQNPTQSLGASPNNQEVPGFLPEPVWPCVGESRTVPDYISLFPQSHQVAPFAGATRNLCDRKEVTLNDQAGAIAKFYIFTSTHKASKFTGVITDDFTSEFDPFSPQFGEKFAPPNMPISIEDWTGAEISRVYSDWWGAYDGMAYSTWEVNPPNPTGYSPNMMIFCMNGKTKPDGTTDPLFNPAYSQFCYELPYMPGQTDYLDTPVVPTSAFSAGYNHPDCSYPDATPAIAEVDGDKGKGPWASAAGVTMTITALGDQQVTNYGYSGPQATTTPFNAKTVNRHYGFGAQCTTPTAGSTTCSTLSSVTVGGVPAAITAWSDSSIQFTVPAVGGARGVPQCTLQQEAQYGGSTAYCGQLVITAGNGKQSIDSVTITIGGKAPVYVTGNNPLTPTSTGSIQQAIDAAEPGDLIMVPPGTYYEMLLMWKPVRLQGVGAGSVTIDANTQPAGKMDPWRRQVDCLFGLALNGQPISAGNPYDPSGTYSCGTDASGKAWTGFVGAANSPQIDRLPLEGIVGWDTTVNGNLAQLLQEPTLMGAYEGAGVTVLGKGVYVPPSASSGYYGSGSEATFPAGTLNLNASAQYCGTGTSGKAGYVANPNPSSFWCNPSSIDGLTITDSSNGGGGIFTHAWTHNLQIANNRIYSNIGTLSGGINIGQGEFPDAYLNGTTLDTNPGSCESGAGDLPNTQEPYCFQIHVNVHNNYVAANTSIGDELFSGTPAGAGGVSFCTGSDYYNFNYNWVCGNMSTGDGGGLSHLGFIKNGDIEHNSVLFNQSLNPTIPTNGGGIIVMGAAPDGNQIVNGVNTECGSVTDNDCAPGLSDGTGPGLVINANLIQGNAAEAGSGGGIRLQSVNGTEVPRFPSQPASWYAVTMTNNLIINNVAGWDGAGVSLQDALVTNLINNTIASNDTTATAGVLSDTIGAPLASAPVPGQTTTNSGTASLPQPAGLVTMANSPVLTGALTTGPLTCPTNHGTSGVPPANGGGNYCAASSIPYIANDLFWQNRAFYVGVGALSAQYQQNIVSIYNAFTTTAPTNQSTTGQCVSGSSYWDMGARGDIGPGDHSSGITLAPTYSVLTNSSENGNGNNNLLASNPLLVSQYCNGSRVPPEFAAGTFNVPPGISDATVPNPIFQLTPTATVDEGNNWINMVWGPLSMFNPSTGAQLGNYALSSGSTAIDYVPVGTTTGGIPAKDFFGNPRPDANNPKHFDVGAIEFQGVIATPTLASITPNSGVRSHAVSVTLTGTNLTGATAVTVSGAGVTVSGMTVVNDSTITATFTIAANAGLTARTVTVTTGGGTSNGVTFTVAAPSLTAISPNTGARGATVPVTITGVGLTGATAVNVSGAGVTVSGMTIVNDSTITASFAIAGTAGLTARNVTVTTPSGNTNAVVFTVTAPAAPTLTAISPNTGVRGTSVAITLTGTNLTGASKLTVSGAGVTVSNLTVTSATTATATFTITSTAALTARTVTITTPGGTATGTFTVQGPTVAAISPASGVHGTAALPVTLTGANLSGATAITISGGGMSCSITGTTLTSISASCAITTRAAHSARNIIATTPIGKTNTLTGAFTVN